MLDGLVVQVVDGMHGSTVPFVVEVNPRAQPDVRRGGVPKAAPSGDFFGLVGSWGSVEGINKPASRVTVANHRSNRLTGSTDCFSRCWHTFSTARHSGELDFRRDFGDRRPIGIGDVKQNRLRTASHGGRPAED